jgi:nicotinamide riboside transporter PnuC
MIITLLNWVFVVIAMLGAYLNARQKVIGFWLWLVSNGGLAVLNLASRNYAQMSLFCVYEVINVYGIMQWTRSHDNGK